MSLHRLVLSNRGCLRLLVAVLTCTSLRCTAARHGSHASPPDRLSVYVYDLPERLVGEVRREAYTQEWMLRTGEEFEAEFWVHDAILNSSVHTLDPEEADLFFIPVYPAKKLHASWRGDPNQYFEASNASVAYLREALHLVHEHEFWARHNGADHFVALASDYGKCTHFENLPKSLTGKIFAVQHFGDLMQRDFATSSEFCFDPDTDIVIPPHLPHAATPLVSPFDRNRDISVLYRFNPTEDAVGQPASKPYHGIFIRKELARLHQVDPIQGSNWLYAASLQSTLDDMAQSVFCVCPTGNTAWTSRFYKAIRRGCIPVTFFRTEVLPFLTSTEYQMFTINIQPSNLDTMKQELEWHLDNDERIIRLQTNLAAIQSTFYDSQDLRWGLTSRLFRELRVRAARLARLHARVASL